jgi:hypothetical protein
MDQLTNNIYMEQDLKTEGPSRDRCNYSEDCGFHPGGLCTQYDEPCLCWSIEVVTKNTNSLKRMCRKTMAVSGFETELEERVYQKRNTFYKFVRYNERLQTENDLQCVTTMLKKIAVRDVN